MKWIPAMLALTFAVLLTGCGKASMPEAIFAVKQLPDCKEVVQVIANSGSWHSWTEVDSAIPILQKQTSEEKTLCNHVIVYRTKSGGLRVATLDQHRPPKITALSQEFK